VEVAQQSLDLASKLVQDNQTRVEIGTMAPIDVVQAQSEQATRRQALVTAQSTRRTAELALKRLIVGGTERSRTGRRRSTRSIARTSSRRRSTSRRPYGARSSERTDIAIAKKTSRRTTSP
jgi:outer membrane protein TolC